MILHITGRHINVTNAIKCYVEKKISKLERFSHKISNVHVILQVQRFQHIVEITVKGKDLDLRVEEAALDMYASFDKALDRIVLAVERHAEKSKGRKRANRVAREAVKRSAALKLKEIPEPKIIRSTNLEGPMTLQEAALALVSREKNQFLVFENANTREINVIYKRKDGDLGWIEPK